MKTQVNLNNVFVKGCVRHLIAALSENNDQNYKYFLTPTFMKPF